MSDLLMEGSHTLISLAIGGLAGYCVAYVTGLKAVRKGMQLILRASLNDMYCRFQSAPRRSRKSSSGRRCTACMSALRKMASCRPSTRTCSI